MSVKRGKNFSLVTGMKEWLRNALFGSLFLSALLLMAGAYLLFSNTFGNAWSYDDFPVIVNNPGIRSLQDFWRNFSIGRPLRVLTYLVDYHFFGLDPTGYHIQNIFWHGLNACLIFTLVGRLGGTKTVAWAASLFFLVHPIQVEVVTNISNRKDSLSLAFSLLSFLAYTEAIQPSRRRLIWLVAALPLAVLAFMAKQNAAVIPLIFLGYEKAYLPARERFLLRKAWPWALVLAAGIVVFFGWYLFFDGRDVFLQASRERLARINYFSESSESVYFPMMLKSWAFMFLKLLFPLKLAPDYIYPVPKSWCDLWVVCALAGLTLYCALVVTTLNRSSMAFLSLVWLGAFWLPTSNLWPLSYFAADRYLYAPSVGFCVLSGLLLNRFLTHPKVRFGVLLVLVLCLSILTWRQNAVWHSTLSLWTHSVKISPQSHKALNNLGVAYMDKKEYDQALDLFLRAAKANPFFAPPHYNLGYLYERLGETEKAIEHFRYFIEMDVPAERFKVMVLRERLRREYGVILQKSDPKRGRL